MFSNFLKGKNICIIASHPDDIEISMGGLLLSQVYKKATIIILTKGGNMDCEKSLEKPSRLYMSTELLKKMSGNRPCTIHQLGFEDGEKTNWSKKELQKRLPLQENTVYFTHYPMDTHPDHVRCSKWVQSIVRPPHPLIFFDSVSSKNFVPNTIYPLDEQTILAKSQMIHDTFFEIFGKKYYFNKEYIIAKALNIGSSSTKLQSWAEGYLVSFL